jgi:TatA/E family protein of Tat protein translocase
MFRSPIFDAVVIIVVLLLFAGPKRLPLLSRSIGESIKEFKGGIGTDSAQEKGEITGANAAPAAPSAAPREAVDSAPEKQS